MNSRMRTNGPTLFDFGHAFALRKARTRIGDSAARTSSRLALERCVGEAAARGVRAGAGTASLAQGRLGSALFRGCRGTAQGDADHAAFSQQRELDRIADLAAQGLVDAALV